MAHGSRKGVGPGSAISLTQKWVFVERDNEAFVWSCSHRSAGSDSHDICFKIPVRAEGGGLRRERSL